MPTLIRISGRLGFEDDRQKYLVELGDTKPAGTDASAGDLPLLIFLGKSPRKVSSEVVLADDYKLVLPVFQTQSNPIRGVRMFAESQMAAATDTTATVPSASGVTLTSVESLASQYSGKLFASELLKEILRRKVQKHMVQKVGDKVGSTTEGLLKTVFFFAQEADLRTWSSLPAYVQIVRIPKIDSSDTELALQYTDDHEKPLSAEPVSFALPDPNTTPLAILRAW